MRGIWCDVLKIDGSLARNIDFEVANFQVLRKTRRKTSILKLQSVKIGESLAQNAVCGFPVASPCQWGKLQNLSFCHVANCENWRKSPTKCWLFCIHVSWLESLVFLWRHRVYGGSWKTSPIRMCPSRLSCRFAWQVWRFVTFQPVLPTCLITRGKYQNWRMSRTKCLFSAPTCLVSCVWFSCGVAVSMGEAAKHLLSEGFQAGCHVVLRGRRGALWHSNLFATNVSNMLKLQEVSYEMRVFLHACVLSRVSGFPVASPCLWGKVRTPHSTLHTPHSTVYTWDSTLYTLLSKLYPLHFTLLTPHSRLYTPHSTLYTPHSSLYTLHSTLYTLHSTLDILHSRLYILQTLLTPHFTLHTPHFTLQTPHSTLHTLHSTLYTLHTTLCTLHSTLYTPHFTIYTPHSTLYTLHVTLYTTHPTPYIYTLHTPHPTLYTPHSSLYTPHSTLYTFHCPLHTPHSTLHTPHFTLYSPHSTLHTLQSALLTLHCAFHTPHSTLSIPHSTLYTLHSTLHTLHSTLCTVYSTRYTPHSTLQTGNRGNKSVQLNYCRKVFCDCISMCFDICAPNIRVSIRVCGLHLVFW